MQNTQQRDNMASNALTTKHAQDELFRLHEQVSTHYGGDMSMIN
jgi:hypothetical protein